MPSALPTNWQHCITSPLEEAMPSETNKGLFMLLPDGPIWKSEDVKSMQGFMEEFNRRAEAGDSPDLIRVFEKLIDTLGVETCTQALDRVKEQRQQQQQQQQQHLPGYQSTSNNAAVSSTSAYPNRTTADGTRHEQENGVHTGQGMQAAETLQTLMTSHVGGKGFRSPMAAAEPGESGSGNDSSSGGSGGGGGGDAFHSATGPSEGSPSHSLSLSPLGKNNITNNNTNAMDLLPLQSQATLYGQGEGASGPSSPGAFATTTTASSSNGNPPAPVIPPAALSWAGVPPIPTTLPSLQAPTLRMPIPPIAYTFEGVTRHFATTGEGNRTTETAADLSHTVKPEISPAAAGSRKRTRSSSASSSAPAPAPAASAAAAAAEAAAALTVTTSLAAAVEDGYIPTPRNDGPWHYLGTLPSSSSPSSSSAAGSGGGGGGGAGGKETGGGGGTVPAAAASSGSASSAGSDEEGTKARPAAMNFGRYGDHLPYNGRKVCRVKGCDGNQRWPDYLCGQHGGGRCRWEGCTLFHQGINSMGLLLCGKHCKAVGATYRRPRGGANPKAEGGGGGGGGGGVTASSSAARKRK